MSFTDLIIEILNYLGFGILFIGIFVLGVFFLIFYPKAKILVSDILRLFGWTGKFIRRKSVETEIEGSINSFIKDFNSQLQYPFFPDCEVEWITARNQKSLMKPGKAIIRVNFEEDHELNFFNTTLTYTQIALLYRTKPFIREITRRAIDLLTTKQIIKKTRKKVLQIFNDRFASEDSNTKELFFKLEETEGKGLFTRVFIQELHFLGESLGEKSPSIQIENEIEDFVDWFYKLATRESEERTDLFFGRTNIKVGIILVANEETYKKYGLEPYLRRAYKYASDEFDSIYIIARGKTKGDLSITIAEELEAKYGFEKLTKNIQVTLIDEKGNKQFITCIALKPNLTTIIQRAWETLANNFNQKTEINVIIDAIEDEDIRVDAYGLKVFIDKSNLSDLDITNPHKYFKIEQELSVTISEFEADKNKVTLSNKGTETDPKKIVDLQLNKEKAHKAVVTRIKDSGLQIRFNDIPIAGYILREYATSSRYVILSKKYVTDQEIEVKIINFDPRFDNFICEPMHKIDPWLNFQYQIGEIYDATICEIRERYITCEISEGVDGRIYIEELDWKSYEENETKITKFNIGDRIKVYLLNIDFHRKSLTLSIKRTSTNPILEFYKKNKNSLIQTNIKKVIPRRGVELRSLESNLHGFIPISEIMWCFCEEFPDNISEETELKVRVIDYDNYHNKIICSLKRVESNDFKQIVTRRQIGDEITGELNAVGNDMIYLKLFFDDCLSFGYLHKSEISNISYITGSCLKYVIEPRRKYPFLIKRFDHSNNIIEVSRKKYYLKNRDTIEYATEYSGTVISKSNSYSIVHFEKFEAILDSQKFDCGQDIKAFVARKDKVIEVETT